MALHGIILLVASRNKPQDCMAFLAIISLCLNTKQPAAAFHSISHGAAA